MRLSRVIGATVTAAVIAASTLAAPAAAAPGPVRQTNTGVGNGSGFTASLKKPPTAGNVIVIVVGLESASTVGVLEPDDVANVVGMSESFTAFGVPGAPYTIVYGAKADPAVKTWGFHGVAQPAAWLAVELAGIQTFASGVPIWDNPATGSAHTVGAGETQLNSGHRADTAVPREFLVAAFVARQDVQPTFTVTAGAVPPTVTSFSNLYPQPGVWARLASTAVTSTAGTNIRLDVAYKVATEVGSYDCLAVWSAAPDAIAASMTPLYAN